MKVALNGSCGRMAGAVKEVVEKKYREITLFEFDIKLNNLAQLDNDDLKFDAIIDFSTPDGFKNVIEVAFKRKIPLVSGTTAITRDLFKKMEDYSKKIPIFYSPNMSIGINICFYIVDLISKRLDADVGIYEIHHKFKKDIPSGTALMFKNIIESNNRNVSVVSSRIGDIVGEHNISFALYGEKILLSHTAYNRNVFAEGAIAALKWIVGRKPGLYSFKDIFNL